jgi:hypothetical protein
VQISHKSLVGTTLSALGALLIYLAHGFIEDIKADVKKSKNSIEENDKRIVVIETNLGTMKETLTEIKDDTRRIWDRMNEK